MNWRANWPFIFITMYWAWLACSTCAVPSSKLEDSEYRMCCRLSARERENAQNPHLTSSCGRANNLSLLLSARLERNVVSKVFQPSMSNPYF